MAITGLCNTSFDIGDEVLYLDPNNKDTPYVNGVVRAVVPIAGGPDRLNVILDDGRYVYHNCNKFVKVWKMRMAEPKIKQPFKKGDRVIWDDTTYNKKRKATVIACCDDEYYTIEVDNYSKYDTFNVHVDNLEPMNKETNMDNVADKEYAVKCAKWFKSAYSAITKAGGVPEYVIDSIPADVLDNLIRNDLHLEYKK